MLRARQARRAVRIERNVECRRKGAIVANLLKLLSVRLIPLPER